MKNSILGRLLEMFFRRRKFQQKFSNFCEKPESPFHAYLNENGKRNFSTAFVKELVSLKKSISNELFSLEMWNIELYL